MINKERAKKISDLEDLVAEVFKLKKERDLRRPLLIEFCGSPKSGKSTTINSLNIFLKRNKLKTAVLTERASVCPVSNKEHPFFNLWTLTSSIAETIKHLEQCKDPDIKKLDIIIADRGIFDSLCWFNWMNTKFSTKPSYLNDENFKSLENFCLMEFWLDSIDLIYVFKVDPSSSIEREYSNLLTDIRGSIMNENRLKEFNSAIDLSMNKYKNKFRKIELIKTDDKEMDKKPDMVGYKVTLNILTILKEILIEKIGYLTFAHDIMSRQLDLSIFENKILEYDSREKVEKSNNIQPLPIVVITNPERNKVLVVKKSSKRTPSDSPENDKLLLYIGGHVRIEDNIDDDILKTFKKALHREIEEEIGESIKIHNTEPFLIYKTDHPKSKKHLGVCYFIEMPLEDKKFKLKSDEFIMKTGSTKSGQVMEINEIINKHSKNLESWSREILKKIFNREIDDTKAELF